MGAAYESPEVIVVMKLGLLTTLAALASIATVAACATSAQTRIANDTPDGGSATEDGGPAAEESDDPAQQPPHSLGTIVLGEAHGSGTSTKSTPIVSATFIPDALLGKACKKELTDECSIQQVPKCTKTTSTTTGCNSNETCSFDTSCKPVCKVLPVCETACEEDEVCKSALGGTSSAGTCVKVQSFDAGPLAFSGTTTAITMFPPYAFESTGQGAPFLGGAELHVQASGATEAGFEKFDEKFTATTFLQTTPSLSKIALSKVFGTGALPIAWAPADDTILITVSGAGGSATCKVKDSLGKFDVPRSVIKAAQGDGTTTTSSSSLSVSVARQRKEIRKDKHAKGDLAATPVQPDGWLELVTLSTESASFQGCSSTQAICDTGCTDLQYDAKNCGACGKACSTGASCYQGACSGGTTSSTCTTCRSNAKVGSCSTYNTTCQNNFDCYDLSSCAASCTTASCVTSCESQYPAGVSAWSPLKSCLASYCSSTCGF